MSPNIVCLAQIRTSAMFTELIKAHITMKWLINIFFFTGQEFFTHSIPELNKQEKFFKKYC